MKGDDFIPLLGLTSDDAKVKSFLGSCGINKQPKLKRGELTAILENKKLGLEITFRDERYLDVRPKEKEYEEGALVLSNVRAYGEGDANFEKFQGELSHALKFEFGRNETEAKLGKPADESEFFPLLRWDYDGHCLFVRFNKQLSEIREASVQLPIKS